MATLQRALSKRRADRRGAWSSLEERDEQLNQPNSQTCMFCGLLCGLPVDQSASNILQCKSKAQLLCFFNLLLNCEMWNGRKEAEKRPGLTQNFKNMDVIHPMPLLPYYFGMSFTQQQLTTWADTSLHFLLGKSCVGIGYNICEIGAQSHPFSRSWLKSHFSNL